MYYVPNKSQQINVIKNKNKHHTTMLNVECVRKIIQGYYEPEEVRFILLEKKKLNINS